MSIDHILVSTQIRCECGPTMVGDINSDPAIMKQLEAVKVYRLGNTFAEYITELAPREVLNRLSIMGYKVIGTAGAGQTMLWTVGKEID